MWRHNNNKYIISANFRQFTMQMYRHCWPRVKNTFFVCVWASFGRKLEFICKTDAVRHILWNATNFLFYTEYLSNLMWRSGQKVLLPFFGLDSARVIDDARLRIFRLSKKIPWYRQMKRCPNMECTSPVASIACIFHKMVMLRYDRSIC